MYLIDQLTVVIVTYKTNKQILDECIKSILGKAKILKKGKHITLISSSYMILECLRASKILKDYFNIDLYLIVFVKTRCFKH